MALVSQGVLWIGNRDVALPRRTLLYGCAMSLLLSSAIRIPYPAWEGGLMSLKRKIGIVCAVLVSVAEILSAASAGQGSLTTCGGQVASVVVAGVVRARLRRFAS
jgi:hypothetical protein